jgi:hypothetical protein
VSNFNAWLNSLGNVQIVDLFDTDASGAVRTRLRGTRQRRLLCRSAAMERAVIDVVKRGLREEDWLGLLYVMAWGTRGQVRPLYIGRANKVGRTPGTVSANLVNLERDKSKFARWGDGNAYHIGDLSQALFGWSSYQQSQAKYQRWSEMLFQNPAALLLWEPVQLVLLPWRRTSRAPDGGLASPEGAEAQAIDLAIEEFEDIVLNVPGEQWWAPQASSSARVPGAEGPRRPIRLIEDDVGLADVISDLWSYQVVGVDVETTLRTQRPCVLQIACPSFTAVIDLLRIRDLTALRGLLAAAQIHKAIHNAAFERRVLGDLGLPVRPVYDTLKLSRALGPRNVSHRLADVCHRELRRRIDKSQQMSDWARRPLTQQQVEYAALDAEVLIPLYEALSARMPPVLPLSSG